MTDIWDEMPEGIIDKIATSRDENLQIEFTPTIRFMKPKFDAWLEKAREELRDTRAQSRIHRQHRVLYQSQRDELGETLELIDTMVQRSVDYWRKSDEGHAEYYVDAYRCIQENLKTIKTKTQSSASTARKEVEE